MAPTSRSASARTCFTSCRREPQATQLPRCFWISLTSARSSSPSSNACSVPSSRCDILPPSFRPIRLYQPPACPRQRCPDRTLGETQSASDLGVIEPLRLEQQGLAIPLVQRGEGGANPGGPFVPLEVF